MRVATCSIPSWRTALGTRLAAAVAAHDAADPVDPGLPLEAARRALDLPDGRLVEVVLRHGAEADRPTGAGAGPTAALTLRDGRVAALAGAGLPPAVRTALRRAARRPAACAPSTPPRPPGSPRSAWAPGSSASLVRNGELLRVADGVVLLPGADDRAVEVLATLGPEFTLSAARQALGTTRRVAVPLLELLARHRPHRAHGRRRAPARPAGPADGTARTCTPVGRSRRSALTRAIGEPPGGSPARLYGDA